MAPLHHFLIIYRRSKGALDLFQDVGTDRAAALTRRFEREALEKSDPDVEVVLLSAPSREALIQTHSRYFKTQGELKADLRATTTG